MHTVLIPLYYKNGDKCNLLSYTSCYAFNDDI